MRKEDKFNEDEGINLGNISKKVKAKYKGLPLWSWLIIVLALSLLVAAIF